MSWKVVEAGSVFEFIRNGASIKQGDGLGGYPITRIETIWNESIDEKRLGFANIFELKNYEGFLLKPGDILMSHINSEKHLGKCAIYEGVPSDLIHGMNLLCLRPNKEILFPRYANYYLKSPEFRNQIVSITNKSVNQASFSTTNLKKLKFVLPPLEEQIRIAEVLDKADSLHQKDRMLLQKYDHLLQSVFLDMFGDPRLNKKGWDKGTFGDAIDVLTDYHANGSYEILRDHVKLLTTKDYALMVRTTDLENNNFQKDVIYIDEHAYNFLNKTKVFGGELIINKIGSAGNVYMMPVLNRPVSLGMNAFMIRVNNDKLSTPFIYYYLKSEFGSSEIQKRVRGAVTRTITKDSVREIPVLYPPIELQRKFSEVVAKLESQKELVKNGTAKSEAFFQSLLQKAFKGELELKESRAERILDLV